MNSASPTFTVAQDHHGVNYESVDLYIYPHAIFHNKRLSRRLENERGVAGRPLDDEYLRIRDQYHGYAVPATMTARELVDHILKGGRWLPGTFDPGATYTNTYGTFYRHTEDTFRSASLLALDFDDNTSVRDVMQYPLVRDYALLVHPSASSSHECYRTRVIWMLDAPITDAQTFRRAMRWLVAQFAQTIDDASTRVTQPWFGSTNRVEDPHVNLGARLPLQTALEWAAEIAQADAAKEAERRARYDAMTPVIVASDDPRLEAYTRAAMDNLKRELTGAPEKQHHQALIRVAPQMASLALGGWPVGDWEAVLTDAASSRASAAEIRAAIKWANKHADPRPLELPERHHRSARRPQDAPPPPPPAETWEWLDPPLPGAQIINQPEIRLDKIDLKTKVTAIRSAIGTGKTRATIKLIPEFDGTLDLSHRRKLVSSIVEAAESLSVVIEDYQSLSREDMRKVQNLAICVDTLASLDGAGVPVKVLVIIEEVMQTLEHITDGGTMKGNMPQRAYEALEFLVKTAQHVIVSDAHLDEIAIDLLAGWVGGRENVTVIDNRYTPDYGKLRVLYKADAAVAAGIELLATPGDPVVFHYASKAKAIALAEEVADIVGSERVLLLTADNSGEERQRAFLAAPDTEAGKYAAIISTPVLGTGFSCLAPVRAAVLIGGRHLNAYDHRQMIGRFRLARQIFAYVPDTDTHAETDHNVIFEERLERADNLRTVLNDAGVRVAEESAPELRFLRLASRLEARSNASHNARRGHFLSLCAGYTIEHASATENDALHDSLKAREQARDERLKALALTVAAVDRDAYSRAQSAGQVSELITAGARRFEIEDLIGRDISTDTRDLLWTPQRRKQYRNFANWYDERGYLVAHDQRQAMDKVPHHRRDYATPKRDIGLQFRALLFDSDGAPIERTREQMETDFAPLIDAHARELRLYFGWRPERCETTTAIVRLVLRKHGLTLVSSRRRVDGAFITFYRLDGERHDTLEALVPDTLRAWQERRNAPESVVIKNCQKSLTSSMAVFDQQSTAPPFRPPFRPDTSISTALSAP